MLKNPSQELVIDSPPVRWSLGASILLLSLGQFMIPAVVALPLALLLALRTKYPRSIVQFLSWSLFLCGAVYLGNAAYLLNVKATELSYVELALQLLGGILYAADGLYAAITTLPKRDADPQDLMAMYGSKDAPTTAAKTRHVSLSASALCWFASAMPLIIGSTITEKLVGAATMVAAACLIYLNRREDLADIGLVQTMRWTMVGCGLAICGLAAQAALSDSQDKPIFLPQMAAGGLMIVVALAAFGKAREQVAVWKPTMTLKKTFKPSVFKATAATPEMPTEAKSTETETPSDRPTTRKIYKPKKAEPIPAAPKPPLQLAEPDLPMFATSPGPLKPASPSDRHPSMPHPARDGRNPPKP
jgi:hypothetical protein